MKGNHVFEPSYENLTGNTEVVLTKRKHFIKLQFRKTWSGKIPPKNCCVTKCSAAFPRAELQDAPRATDHDPESFTLHYGENKCGRRWVVATEGEKGTYGKKEETPKTKFNVEAE